MKTAPCNTTPTDRRHTGDDVPDLPEFVAEELQGLSKAVPPPDLTRRILDGVHAYTRPVQTPWLIPCLGVVLVTQLTFLLLVQTRAWLRLTGWSRTLSEWAALAWSEMQGAWAELGQVLGPSQWDLAASLTLDYWPMAVTAVAAGCLFFMMAVYREAHSNAY